MAKVLSAVRTAHRGILEEQDDTRAIPGAVILERCDRHDPIGRR